MLSGWIKVSGSLAIGESSCWGFSLLEVEMKPCSEVGFLGLLQYKYNLINEKEKLLAEDMNY